MKIGRKFASYLSIGLGVCALPQLASAATYTVTNLNDSGAGSLRAAITSANAVPGSDIVFNLTTGSVGGTWTIKPLTPLPIITANGTEIDGTSQTTFGGDTNLNGPEVVINGSSLAGTLAPKSGFLIGANSCVIRNLVINAFDLAGVDIDVAYNASGTAPTNNRVYGCYLGTNAAGNARGGGVQYYGVRINGANSSLIGGTTNSVRNVLSGNNVCGVTIEGGGSQNLIQGNYIGTDRTGTTSVANTYGVQYLNSSVVSVGQNSIGGTSAATRNLISGNRAAQIIMDVGDGTIIQNNNIGTDVTGNSPLADSIGTPAIGIQLHNTHVVASSGPVLIGGTNATRNVIGDCSTGIDMQYFSDVNIQGNYIGVGRNGSSSLANATGIQIDSRCFAVQIGGSSTTSGNIITNSYFRGIGIFSFQASAPSDYSEVAIRCNSIYNNGDQGIAIRLDGVDTNDNLDPDLGPNSAQNYPIISAASTNGSSTTITGTFNSKANTTYLLDFYSIQTPDADGHGEGRTYLGTQTVTTNASGNATISLTAAGMTAGHYVTGTATGSNGTSEFSAARIATSSSSLTTASSGSDNKS